MPPTGVSISTCLSSPFCSFFTFTLQAGRSSVPRVRSEAHISHVGAFAHVNAADGRVDIDLFVFSILLFFYVHAAGWQKKRAQGREPQGISADGFKFNFAHAETLLWQLAPGVRDRRRAGQHVESSRVNGRESESPRRAP